MVYGGASVSHVLRTGNAACGTWLVDYSLNHDNEHTAMIVLPDIPTRKDCCSECEAHSQCDAAAWRASSAYCWLRQIPEANVGTVGAGIDSFRACEPGVELRLCSALCYGSEIMILQLGIPNDRTIPDFSSLFHSISSM